MKTIILAAALGLTAAQAQATCLAPRNWASGAEQNIYEICRQQEQQATDDFYRCLDEKRRRADRGDYDGAMSLQCFR